MSHAFYPQLDHCWCILKPIDDSLSPGPCLGDVGCEVLRVARMSIMEISMNVDSFSCQMLAYYFLVNVIMWNSFLHNVPSVRRWCQYPI
jgi:hypothetical protein